MNERQKLLLEGSKDFLKTAMHRLDLDSFSIFEKMQKLELDIDQSTGKPADFPVTFQQVADVWLAMKDIFNDIVSAEYRIREALKPD